MLYTWMIHKLYVTNIEKSFISIIIDTFIFCIYIFLYLLYKEDLIGFHGHVYAERILVTKYN